MWESRRDFQRVWEGWEAGFMAFHAFHTLSFPWPAFRAAMLEKPTYRQQSRNSGNTVRYRAMLLYLSLHPGCIPGDMPTTFVELEGVCVPRRGSH
jgi:hypothetical protein